VVGETPCHSCQASHRDTDDPSTARVTGAACPSAGRPPPSRGGGTCAVTRRGPPPPRRRGSQTGRADSGLGGVNLWVKAPSGWQYNSSAVLDFTALFCTVTVNSTASVMRFGRRPTFFLKINFAWVVFPVQKITLCAMIHIMDRLTPCEKF
jgi:hypothetical protein